MDLNLIWFILLVVLFIGYVALDGFDLGVGTLHLFAKSDDDRRKMINAIAPVWDGNEVWLITAGGALFAAFPDVYATVFSGFYTALMLLLAVLIGRAVSMEFRSKVETESWRGFWDKCFSVSSYVISILLGVAFANIIIGLKVDATKEYVGTFFDLLGPYQLVFGFLALFAIMTHGSIYAAMKTEGDLQSIMKSKFRFAFFVFVALLVVNTIMTWTMYPAVTANMRNHPITAIAPVLAIISIILTYLRMNKGKIGQAFTFSFITIAMLITTASIGLFPNLVPSNINPAYSLSIYNASSSQATLQTMLIIACIGVPIVLIYTIAIYRIFRGKVKIEETSY